MKRLFILLATVFAVFKGEETDPIVTIRSGVIRGVRSQYGDRIVNEFLGIPYAQPPINELRFKPPVPIKRFSGVLNATDFSSPCVQGNFFAHIFPEFFSSHPVSEDCLYINVWVPQDEDPDAANPKPVMVHFHGGGFQMGYGGLPINSGLGLAAKGNVIVVTVNSRLGALGYLYADTPDAPGNVGLMDQTEALRFIKRNIKYLGGDPCRIILFGESVGSMSVNIHLISPYSKGLFSRVIMQSGTLSGSAFVDHPMRALRRANAFAIHLGCTTPEEDIISNPEAVLACLRMKSPESLLAAQEATADTWVSSFVPTSQTNYLPRTPSFASRRGLFQEVDMLIGTAKDEGSMFLKANFTLWEVQKPPNISGLEEAINQTMKLIRQYHSSRPMDNLSIYFPPDEELSNPKLIRRMSDAIGDILFVCPALYTAEDHAFRGNNVYYYRFSHHRHTRELLDWMGVAHGSELVYIFGLPDLHKGNYTKGDEELSDDLIQLWTSFARSGNPGAFRSVEWPLFNKETQQVLNISGSPEIITNLRKPYCDYWRKTITRL